MRHVVLFLFFFHITQGRDGLTHCEGKNSLIMSHLEHPLGEKELKTPGGTDVCLLIWITDQTEGLTGTKWTSRIERTLKHEVRLFNPYQGREQGIASLPALEHPSKGEMMPSEESQKGFEWKSNDREKKRPTVYVDYPRASCPMCWK
jgi:hypothetical protein